MPKVVAEIIDVIVNPILAVLFVLAVVVFLWGIFRFVSSDDGATAREQGKQSMIWGIVGFFIMVSAYGIIAFIKSTIGL